jgi:predicted aldo/keto reductase-like oxidoreductase
MVGAALKSKRKDLIISTKTHAMAKEQALQDLDTSLKELGTDYVDIWYLHGKSRPEELTDSLIEALQTAKKSGKARYVGVSTHNGQKELIPGIISKAPNFDVILTSYNFTMNADLDAVIESAAKAGIGFVAMKVMAGGSKSRRGPANPVLTREGAMLAALKWVLKNKNIHTTIPSITDMEQLDENIRALSNPFTDADQKILTAHLQDIRPLYCSMCGSCSGKCPKGMPVADVLRYLTYAEGYGEFQLGRENFLALSQEVKNIRCSSCETCSIKCPNSVHVTQRLMRAQELFA